jgi:hypothetical protein
MTSGLTIISSARDFLDGADPADPRKLQHRHAATPSGREVWVEITGDDRLRIIKKLPGRWPEVMMARERGDTLEQIARWVKLPLNPETECKGHCKPECLRCHLSGIYAWLETELHELANRRAALMV